MKYHSQNREAEIVIKYFDGYVGTVLDIGANDGITFSNSYDLIQQGWRGVLIEPSKKAFKLLSELYPETSSFDRNTLCLNYGISVRTELSKFYQSGSHLPDNSDIALLSGKKIQEKWSHLVYDETEASFKSFSDFYIEDTFTSMFDCISIDCEGEDWDILQQIDLTKVECRCLVIEWNGKWELRQLFTEYCQSFGLREIHTNNENIIFAK